MTNLENPKGLRRPLGFLIILFALAYTQAPLFSSNQNQYFLHGMARAGMGSLQADWLASTLDPTPVFSFIIYILFSITRWKEIVYLLYAVLMGVYLFSLLGILDHLYPLRTSSNRFLLAVGAVVILHSAALRFVLVRLLGSNWAFFFDGGLAGQRLLGSVFQPSTFGVFLLLSIYLFLRGRRAWAVLSAVLATVVHPTYLLAAGLLCAGYLIVTGPLERRWKQAAWLGVLALAAVAPVLVYVYGSFGQAAQPEAAQIAAEARRILVEFRIPHHAQIATWFDLPSALKLGLVAAALAAVRKQRALFTILLTVSLACTALTILQLLTGSDVLALLFPWRPSALIVPLATTLLVGSGIQRLPDTWLEPRPWIGRAALATLLLAALAGVVYTFHAFQQQAAAPERDMLEWVAENSSASDHYLIPIKMENFRLKTLRPAYVDFMAIPYAGPDVLRWYHRLLSTDRFYRERPCNKVVDFAADGGVTHIISEREQPFDCHFLIPIYQDDHYTVYWINRDIW
jgi:hypothetical protein